MGDNGMSTRKVAIKKNRYLDSVFLMAVAHRLGEHINVDFYLTRGKDVFEGEKTTYKDLPEQVLKYVPANGPKTPDAVYYLMRKSAMYASSKIDHFGYPMPAQQFEPIYEQIGEKSWEGNTQYESKTNIWFLEVSGYASKLGYVRGRSILEANPNYKALMYGGSGTSRSSSDEEELRKYYARWLNAKKAKEKEDKQLTYQSPGELPSASQRWNDLAANQKTGRTWQDIDL